VRHDHAAEVGQYTHGHHEMEKTATWRSRSAEVAGTNAEYRPQEVVKSRKGVMGDTVHANKILDRKP